jgi:hypothetical protein
MFEPKAYKVKKPKGGETSYSYYSFGSGCFLGEVYNPILGILETA